jgi:hypothetical protein
MSRSLTVEELLDAAGKTEKNLSAFEATAPQAVERMGGRDALARLSQMTCVGPIPQLTVEEWCAMSEEYEESRTHGGSLNRGR